MNSESAVRYLYLTTVEPSLSIVRVPRYVAVPSGGLADIIGHRLSE